MRMLVNLAAGFSSSTVSMYLYVHIVGWLLQTPDFFNRVGRGDGPVNKSLNTSLNSVMNARGGEELSPTP